MEFALPRAFRHETLNHLEEKKLFLIFLSILLRIWATIGELMLAGIAYLFDLRGAMGRPDAPGVLASAHTDQTDHTPDGPRFHAPAPRPPLTGRAAS